VREAVTAAEDAQRTALAAQKLEALGRLTGGIAHDFNNLLQAMLSGVQLASRLATDDRARKALATCDRAIAKAVKLTRQLMSFGLAQPGHFETIDVRQQLDALRELLRGALLDAVTVRATRWTAAARCTSTPRTGAWPSVKCRGCPPATTSRSAWPTPARASHRR
jgi:C4-dicarboxylate-specific signal transduction histidine kinase